MCFPFSSEFCAAVSVPHRARSSVCQRLKLHRESRGSARETDCKREREREKGGIKDDRVDKHKRVFEMRESESERNLLKAAENQQRHRGNEGWREGVGGYK